MSPETQMNIQKKAFEIWQANGCPDDKELDHWLQAEEQISGKKTKSKRKPRAWKPA